MPSRSHGCLKLSIPTKVSSLNNNLKILIFPEIFTNLLVEDTWRKSSSSQDFLEDQKAANASPSKEDQYLSTCEEFKLIAFSVQELWWSKVELTNLDAAAAAGAAAAAVAL
jgi:hypothetical protein